MNAPLYTIEILRLAASLAEPTRLDRVDGEGSERSPTCGSRVSVLVQLDAGGRVAALSQRVEACAFGQASATLVEAHAIGRSLDEVEGAEHQVRAWLAGGPAPEWPGFEALAPARPKTGRHGAILLPLRALAAAMKAAR